MSNSPIKPSLGLGVGMRDTVRPEHRLILTPCLRTKISKAEEKRRTILPDKNLKR